MGHFPLMFLSELREFSSASCLTGKKNLMRARVSMLLRSRASPDMLPCSICSKKRLAIRHMNRPLFSTTLSIPSYDNREVHVGRAENWPAPPRTAQIRCAQILKKSRNRLKFYTLDGWNEKKNIYILRNHQY